ncbi:Asp23/Gls24 family envelope stress response protein [Rhodococcus sp. SGAir0479]|uniref:Asp23/Gls24 family envelope stress response protein n=1 Tax=Rhodococcus sp. SGAir0479 TaxID=2567884 RepID=UPI0010CCFD07|nr:Asp23/Gls24 family envelope stress response protein [Rhodococcus sp. SGAir0479]QCQ92230.1 Asp23/Gls24 family envelope stress response protein [Rhodococcus sp. SGAir0479]
MTTDPTAGASTIGGDRIRFGASASRELSDSHGKTIIADAVVAKIAGIATRQINGVYDLGGGTARVVGALRDRIPGAGVDHAQGVSAEVGEKQAAIDIGIVAEYGVALHELAAGIRRNVIAAVENMTGLEVTEVDITVHDVILLDETDPGTDPDAKPRVQ